MSSTWPTVNSEPLLNVKKCFNDTTVAKQVKSFCLEPIFSTAADGHYKQGNVNEKHIQTISFALSNCANLWFVKGTAVVNLTRPNNLTKTKEVTSAISKNVNQKSTVAISTRQQLFFNWQCLVPWLIEKEKTVDSKSGRTITFGVLYSI